MIKTILLPTDFTIESQDLLACIREFKKVGLEKVILLHVVDIFHAQGLAPRFERHAREKIEEYKVFLDQLEIESETIVQQGDIQKTIAYVADDKNADCIVMGATTSGIIKGRLLGRTTEYIARTSKKILLVEKYDSLKSLEENTFKKACSAKFDRVLVPLDFSEESMEALKKISQLEGVVKDLILVNVIERVDNIEELEMKKHDNLTKLKELSKDLERFNLKYHVTAGVPSEEIDKLADEENATLIALTTHRKGLIKDILIGSTAENLLRKTVKPVLLIPSKKR